MGSKSGKKHKKKDEARREHEGSERKKLKTSVYEKELFKLQVELCKLQEWVKETGTRAIVVFEGRDAAGKGGVLKRITERVSPRVFRWTALPAPSSREKTQYYIQRYMAHFPAAGEIVLFDRSWYNRPGVERVLGFCSDEEVERFFTVVGGFESSVVDSGIRLLKYWFEVSFEEQQRRFLGRINDPTKHWKLSPTDLESQRLWYDYSRARDDMLARTNTGVAPWHIVPSDNKKRARLNCISHLLSQFPYEEIPFEMPEIPKRKTKHEYDDTTSLEGQTFVPEKY
ncbi:MAG: polyphosphate kinase 2 [Myxococcota bacterium]|nr:polyphosphate kinase 2 [Myxococcota bacterium]